MQIRCKWRWLVVRDHCAASPLSSTVFVDVEAEADGVEANGVEAGGVEAKANNVAPLLCCTAGGARPTIESGSIGSDSTATADGCWWGATRHALAGISR